MTKLSYITIAFLIACLGYLVWWGSHQTQINFGMAFIAGQTMSIATFLLLAWRTQWILNKAISFKLALKVTGVTLVTSLLTPAKLSDFAAKPFYLQRLGGIAVKDGLLCVVKERLWDVIGLALLCLCVPMMASQFALSDNITKQGYLLASIGIVAVVGLIVMPSILLRFSLPATLQQWLMQLANTSLKEKLLQLCLAFIIWWSSVAMLYLFYNFTGLPALSIPAILVIFIASVIGLVATVTPGGIGTYEAAMAGLLVTFDVPMASAIAVAVGFRICWLALPFLVFLIALAQDGRALISSTKEIAHDTVS
jgi:uncharacterized membrane protein YbhN (UPF0104 family)